MNAIDVNYMLDVLGAIVGFTCVLVVSLVSWNWLRLHQKIDEIVATVKELAEDVRKDINDHEIRLTVIERDLDVHRRKGDGQ